MVVRIDPVGQIIDAFGRPRNVEFLAFRRLMVVIAPSHRDSLQLGIAFEVRATAALLHEDGLVGVDQAEGDLDALADDRASYRIVIPNLEKRHAALMPVVVLRVEESDTGGLAVYDIGLRVQNLLGGVRALR